MDKCSTRNITAAKATEPGENFGEYESICADVIKEIDTRKKEWAGINKDGTDENDRIVATGSAVSDLAMNHKSGQSSLVLFTSHNAEKLQTRIPHHAHGESQRNMVDAIKA